MKNQTLAVACAIITLTMDTYASEKLDRLRSEYSKQAIKEIGGINSQYEKKLKMALASAEKFNKQEEAEEIREELEALKDLAYLLKEDNPGAKQFQGEWLVTYGEGKTRICKIDRFGKVRTKKGQWGNGDPWGGGFTGKLEYDDETKRWVCKHVSGDITCVEFFEMKDGVLHTGRWNGAHNKYPNDIYDKGLGVRTDT